MIKHIVAFKFKEFAEGKDKMENVLKAKELIEGLYGKIENLLKIEVSSNFYNKSIECDLILYSEFQSIEDLNYYQNHPLHLEVADFILKVREERFVFDYEV